MTTPTALRMSEEEWQSRVVEYAALRKWLIAHFRPARTEHGWRTPMTGDAGFPDLVLVRGGRLVFLELKVQQRRLTDFQRRWLDQLDKVPCVEVHVMWPEDWDAVMELLR